MKSPRLRIRTSLPALAVAGALAFAAGCSSDDSTGPTPQPMPQGTPTDFTVTIENVSSVYDFLASGAQPIPIGASEPGPLLPGDVYEVSFHAGPGQHLSLALMFVHSNDWFFAPGEAGIALFDEEGMPRTGDISADLVLWDAGTEHDQSPGAGDDQAPAQQAPNQGMADPVAQVRKVSDPNGELPTVQEVVQATLTHEAGNLFTLRVENVSTDQTLTLPDQSTTAVPLAPVVYALHTEAAPLFSEGQPDRGEGLEALAEDGNPEPLMQALATRTGLTSPLAPGVYAVHQQGSVLFQQGSVDVGSGLEALAEDGDPSSLAGSLGMHDLVVASGVFNTPEGGTEPGPLQPGQSYRFEVQAEPGQYLSFASMFVQSNDLFLAPADHGLALFDGDGMPLSGEITMEVQLWNAGTEIDEAPGAGPAQAPRQSEADHGEAENGSVEPVQGGVWPAAGEIVRVTISVG